MDNFFLGILVGILVVVAVSTVIYALGYDNGFETGQIAAINGDVQYKLVVNKDKSTSWVKIAK